MMKPLDAPEKRPSVISAVELPSPAPMRAAVGPVRNGIRRTVGLFQKQLYPASEVEYEHSRNKVKNNVQPLAFLARLSALDI